jgi:hypothetical protein
MGWYFNLGTVHQAMSEMGENPCPHTTYFFDVFVGGVDRSEVSKI